MILEKTKSPKLQEISSDSVDTEFAQGYLRVSQLYRGAMQEVAVQLDILDNEFEVILAHEPIHHIECRVKSMESLIEKMKRRNIAIQVDNIHKIQDIAGIRIVCNYIHDVYYLRRLLICDYGFQLIRENDYIKSPKPNGYRSLHLIVKVPFMISEGRIELPVEIQLRTIAMDMWASLEHELRYKSSSSFTGNESNKLAQCAERLFQVDCCMQELFQQTSVNREEEKHEILIDGK